LSFQDRHSCLSSKHQLRTVLAAADGRRFEALLARRKAIWDEHDWDAEHVERDVMEAIREVRAERAARPR
jgi:hypothetical protein